VSNTLTVQEHVSYIAEQVNKQLQQSVHLLGEVPSTLVKAMEYSLTAGGKRIRPYLTIATTAAVKGNDSNCEIALDVSCAIEYIHTYSLIHDDLPAMDNDDYRRGKLTNHKVFGEAMAILAGDALLTQSFKFITQLVKAGKLEANVAIHIIDDLTTYSGAAGMVGGQVADIEGEQGITSITQLEYIHKHKTSDLIVCSVLAGARIAGATEYQLEKLTTFATNIGLAFQIQDDILDIIGDEGKLGKKTNSDIEQQKVTYPYLIGLEESEQRVKELTREAKSAIVDAQLNDEKRLLEIADYLVKRDY